MTRTVTAIFATYAVADEVRRKIADLGVSSSHVTVVPDTSSDGAQRDDDAVSQVHYLHVPSDDVRTYQQAVRRGHYVVSADVEDRLVDDTAEIMRHPEAVDIDAYEAQYRDEDIVPMAGYETTRGDVEGEEHIQLAEERIAVGKRAVDKGTTHVRTYVQEVPVEERVRLRDEHVTVMRNPVNRVVSGSEADALFKERDISVRETDEEAVISKEAVVTEEVVVGKEVTEHEEVVQDTVRKTQVDVDNKR